jgi:hypothetical protein
MQDPSHDENSANQMDTSPPFSAPAYPIQGFGGGAGVGEVFFILLALTTSLDPAICSAATHTFGPARPSSNFTRATTFRHHQSCSHREQGGQCVEGFPIASIHHKHSFSTFHTRSSPPRACCSSSICWTLRWTGELCRRLPGSTLWQSSGCPRSVRLRRSCWQLYRWRI